MTTNESAIYFLQKEEEKEDDYCDIEILTKILFSKSNLSYLFQVIFICRGSESLSIFILLLYLIICATNGMFMQSHCFIQS